MPTIMLVDDHPIVRRGMRGVLEAVEDFKVVGEATNGLDAISMALKLRPDVIMCDLMMKGISGIEVARQIIKEMPGSNIIIFTMVGSDHYVMEALRSKVLGYVLKDTPTEELIHAIREVAAGHRYLSSGLLDRTIDVFLQATKNTEIDLLDTLSAREREVLYLSAQDKSAAEIAQQLVISRRTVEAQRASIFRKLGLRNQRELISYAARKGLLAPELIN